MGKEDKNQNNTKRSLQRYNFEDFQKAKGTSARATDFDTLEQFQDSLIGRGFGDAQRLALLSTAYNEMDENGAASRGDGGNGILGLSDTRMPTSYLVNTPQGRAKQIHYLLEDLTHVYKGLHPQAGNWNDGGTGGPKIMSGQDGSEQFWKATDPKKAAIILNKSYIRPKYKSDWELRGNDASMLSNYKKKLNGGKLSLETIR